MKHLFIINPAAGKGKTVKLIPEIKEYCESKSLECEIIPVDKATFEIFPKGLPFVFPTQG